MSDKRKVPFSVLKPLINLLRNKEDIAECYVGPLIGYTASAVSHWRKVGEAPEIVKWALLGRIHAADALKDIERPPRPQEKIQLTKAEWEAINAAVSRSDLDPALLAKIGAKIYGL